MSKRGYETLDMNPSIPILLRDIQNLYRHALTVPGGRRAAPVGLQRKGAASPSPDFDTLRDAEEVNEVLERLKIELIRLRRRYWTEIIGPIADDVPGRASYDAKARQRERIQHEYPPHWTNGEIAIVERVSDRWVRELRGADRRRKP